MEKWFLYVDNDLESESTSLHGIIQQHKYLIDRDDYTLVKEYIPLWDTDNWVKRQVWVKKDFSCARVAEFRKEEI